MTLFPHSEGTLEFLRGSGEVARYEAGDLILRRGDPGRIFGVVLEGEVEIRLETGVASPLPLTRLGPGQSFGEMALLRNSPVSADVVAVAATQVLEIPRDAFLTALAEHDSLRTKLLRRLAESLGSTNDAALEQFRRAQAYATLGRPGEEGGDLVVASGRMKKLLRELTAAARTERPVWILGESGTERLRLARELHERSERREGPLVLVDCRRLPREDAGRILFGSSAIGEKRGGVPVLGAAHLAHGGTLVLQAADRLDPATTDRLAERLGPGRNDGLDVRWVLTSYRSETELAPVTVNNGTEVLRVPPLRERPQDILPLARAHLERLAEGKASPVFSPDAERALLSLPYRKRNVHELHAVVELAARCAEGGVIETEHLFQDAGEEDGPSGLELARLRSWVRRFGVEGIRVLAAFGFVTSILILLLAPAGLLARWTNGVVWGVWEPTIIALFLLIGPVWCTVCPLSATARLTQKLFPGDRKPPEFLKKRGIWLASLGFLLILWTERAFHMTEHPRATGGLLLALLVLAVGFAVLYRREVWCRHLCPLGRLASALSPGSIVALAATPSVCTSQCTHHRCFKGSEEIRGCTVFHHPVAAGEGFQCKLCLDCLRSCPHGSTQLYLRPPLQGVWRLASTSGSLAPFATALFFLIPVLLAAQRIPAFDRPLPLGLAGLAAVAIGLAVGSRIRPWLLRNPDTDSAAPERAAFALLVLAWGPLMAYQLANIPLLRDLRLLAPAGSPFLPAEGVPVGLPFEVGVVLLAAALAAFAFTRIRQRLAFSAVLPSHWGWTTLAVLATVHLAFSLVLVLGTA